MKIRSPALLGAAGLLAATTIRQWMATLDYRVAYYDPSVDPPNDPGGPQRIYVFWHEYILAPLYMRGHCNLAMLISQHGDADILDRVAAHFGFACVRGSSRRGGVAALREMLRASRQMHLAITPDGPRGPRRRLAAGPIYLASKLGLPLVCLGVGFDRPWRLRSWDRFAIPRPYSRARGVLGPEIHIPDGLDRGGLEDYRLYVERMLNQLSSEAEAWAELGGYKLDEAPVRPAHIQRRHLRQRAEPIEAGNDRLGTAKAA